jgi:NNP family nitrate/nitrite transporter-like MFS transporter
MGFKLASLWQAPEVNPVNHKARSIPFLNPTNIYGRVFFFGWFGFFIAFWSWYAFPPLLSVTIKADLNMSQTDVANSNIISLAATLLVRVIAGPLCDAIGPRYTFALCLLAGSLPTALAGTITNVSGLFVLRFFIGILGGSFVPCQVWSTGFFDKNVVGTANALAGGWGNAGGGITYFIMPAIFDSLVHGRGLTPHVAWRVAFIVPFILIVATAVGMLLLCPDTPTGKWSERHMHVQQNLQAHGITAQIVDIPGNITDRKSYSEGTTTPDDQKIQAENDIARAKHADYDHEAQMSSEKMLEEAQGEVIVKPSFKEAFEVICTPQTLVTAMCYFCSFGGELAINSILGAYYLKNFPYLGQTGSGNWAAMFGLLNVFFRPAGGIVADLIYKHTKSVWAKKMWVHFLGVMTGVFLIAIGFTDSHGQSTLIGLVAGMAFFLDAGNGANFALVPHVWPFAVSPTIIYLLMT